MPKFRHFIYPFDKDTISHLFMMNRGMWNNKDDDVHALNQHEIDGLSFLMSAKKKPPMLNIYLTYR